MDLYDDCSYEVIDEYNRDHNFVFVKLAGESAGKPMEYHNIYALFKKLKGKNGIHIHHICFGILIKSDWDIRQSNNDYMLFHPSEDEIR